MRKGRVKERERERGEVDEQAATQRGSSKQHNAPSRPSLPPRQLDAPARLSVAALAHALSYSGRKNKNKTKKQATLWMIKSINA